MGTAGRLAAALCALLLLGAGPAPTAAPDFEASRPLPMPQDDRPPLDAAARARAQAEAARLGLLAANPTCKPVSTICAFGRLQASMTATYGGFDPARPDCEIKTRSPMDPCFRSHTDAMQSAMERTAQAKAANESYLAAARLRSPKLGAGRPFPEEEFAGFVDGVRRELETDECPESDDLCTIGRLQTIWFIAELGPDVCRHGGVETGCEARWTRRGAELRAAAGTAFMRLLRARGWPADDWGYMPGHMAERLVQILEADPEVLDATVTAIKASRAVGRTNESYAAFADKLAIRNGARQAYGTQGQCVGEEWRPEPVDDPARLDERRRAAGVGPFAAAKAKRDPWCAKYGVTPWDAPEKSR